MTFQTETEFEAESSVKPSSIVQGLSGLFFPFIFFGFFLPNFLTKTNHLFFVSGNKQMNFGFNKWIGMGSFRREQHVWYILTSFWVLLSPHAGWNMLFDIFLHNFFFAFSVLWLFLFIFVVIWFSIYLVLWIRSTGPARFEKIEMLVHPTQHCLNWQFFIVLCSK